MATGADQPFGAQVAAAVRGRGAVPARVDNGDAPLDFLLVTPYAEVRRAARDWRAFSSDTPFRVPIPHEVGTRSVRQLPIETDPPGHRGYRQLLVPWFDRAAVERVRPALAAIADELVHAAVARGGCEVVADLALPLVLRSLAELLRLPRAHADRWLTWGRDAFTELPTGRKIANPDFDRWLEDTVDAALADPGDDVFGTLARSPLDGRRLTREELLGIGNLLVAAGRGTMVDAVAGALWRLARVPEEADRLRADPGLLPAAVEEWYPWLSPITHLGRTAVAATTVGGHHVEAGGQVPLGFGLANRDPAAFPDPHRFVLDRTPNPHVAFGHGPHRCMGEHLARVELAVLVRAWLDAVRTVEVVGEPAHRTSDLGEVRVVNGFDALHLACR